MAETGLRKTPRRMKQLGLPLKRKGANRRVTHVCPFHDQHLGASVTYQLELVQCGKRKCRRWHGPYWYGYWTAGGKTRSIYIGKALLPAATVAAKKQAKESTTS